VLVRVVACSRPWDRCERSPLQEVEPAAGEGPLEIVAPAEHLVATERERMKRSELCIVEAEYAGEPLGNLRAACAASRGGAYGDVLQSRYSCDDGTVAPQAEQIWDDKTGNDRLPEPPGGLDHELVRPVDGVAAEEHAGGVRFDELLYDDGHSRLAGQPETLSVSER
jgi:hypothetical protein